MARTSALLSARRLTGVRRRLRTIAMSCSLLLVAMACTAEGGSVGPSAGPTASAGITEPDASPGPSASIDPEGLCRRVDELELSTARLRSIDLKVTDRVPLDIELGELMLAFDDLERAELGEFEEPLQEPLRRLSYRLTDVELAVEDFRTNSRTRQAARHVESDARTFANEVAALRVLALC